MNIKSTPVKHVSWVQSALSVGIFLASERRKVAAEYFETYLSHLPVNNGGENFQSLFLIEVKTLAQQKYKNDIREEM